MRTAERTTRSITNRVRLVYRLHPDVRRSISLHPPRRTRRATTVRDGRPDGVSEGRCPANRAQKSRSQPVCSRAPPLGRSTAAACAGGRCVVAPQAACPLCAELLPQCRRRRCFPRRRWPSTCPQGLASRGVAACLTALVRAAAVPRAHENAFVLGSALSATPMAPIGDCSASDFGSCCLVTWVPFIAFWCGP